MTTLIAMHGELFGDRRKLVNYLNSGIVGVRDENKIRKHPYCLYGIMGFEFSDQLTKNNAVLGKYFEHWLTTIAALDYFTDDIFSEHRFVKTATNREELSYFRSTCRALRSMVGKHVAKEMADKGSGLIMLTRGRGFIADSTGWRPFKHSDPIIVGTGKDMATILIDNNIPVAEVYHALRTSGCPTGTKFDKLTVKDDLQFDFPPVCEDHFLAIMVMLVLEVAKERLKEEVFTQKGFDDCLEDLTMAVATFLTMGKIKDGKTVLSRKPVTYLFRSPESRRTKAWKIAAAFTDFKPSQEKE